MDSKDYLTNRAFCPMPWTGLMYNFDGNVKNCIRSAEPIGNIRHANIEDILAQDHQVKSHMQASIKFDRCQPCYDLEKEKNNLDIISDRVFYLKELREVDKTLYDTTNFELHAVDVRWTNLCNFACVYCGPEFSSRWASESKTITITPADHQVEKFKQYVFERVSQLKHVYLAGGEPLLMKENLEFLQLLKQKNPNVNLRINTNLSKVDTGIFDLICEFKNVHWTVSVETMNQEYEYIRYGGTWQDFVDNIKSVKKFNHKISFNMLYFLLNYKSLFECIDFFKSMKFHNNSFIIGPVNNPEWLDIRHLPDHVVLDISKELTTRIEASPGFLLENSYINLLDHIRKPMIKNLINSFQMIKQMDQQRSLNSKNIFTDLYQYE